MKLKFTSILWIFFFSIYCSSNKYVKNINPNKVEFYLLDIELLHSQPCIKLLGGSSNSTRQKQSRWKNLKFIIDTGSNISIIKKKIFHPNTKIKTFIIKSLSRQISIPYAKVFLNLKNTDLKSFAKNNTFYSMELNNQFKFDGLIGNDLLSKFFVIFDIPEKVMFIKKNPNFYFDFLGYEKIHIFFQKGHIFIPLRLNNSHPQNFLFDTGSALSYINPENHKNLGLIQNRKIKYVDISGKIMQSHTYRAKKVCTIHNKMCSNDLELLSGTSLKNFIKLDSIRIDGLLGLNWIKEYVIAIDYDKEVMYIKKKGWFH